MRDQSVNRKLADRMARAAGGRHASQPVTQRGQAQLGLSEPDLLALPQDISQLQNVQAADGSFYFMAGLSDIGGSDPVSP